MLPLVALLDPPLGRRHNPLAWACKASNEHPNWLLMKNLPCWDLLWESVIGSPGLPAKQWEAVAAGCWKAPPGGVAFILPIAGELWFNPIGFSIAICGEPWEEICGDTSVRGFFLTWYPISPQW